MYDEKLMQGMKARGQTWKPTVDKILDSRLNDCAAQTPTAESRNCETGGKRPIVAEKLCYVIARGETHLLGHLHHGEL